MYHRHGHEGQGAGAFSISKIKGEVHQAYQQTKERYLLRGGVLRDSPLHRTILPIFRYTSRPYDEQESLLKDFNQCVEYRKTIEFFIKTKGLHGYFERNGGSLEKAVVNANRSMDEKLKSDRDYTYSELGRLMERLESI